MKLLFPEIFLLALAVAGCAGGSAAGGSTALAAPVPTPAAVSFLAADVNRDGRVSRHEFDSWERAGGDSRHHAFDAADTSHDGVLTLDEWQAMAAGLTARLARAAERASPGKARW